MIHLDILPHSLSLNCSLRIKLLIISLNKKCSNKWITKTIVIQNKKCNSKWLIFNLKKNWNNKCLLISLPTMDNLWISKIKSKTKSKETFKIYKFVKSFKIILNKNSIHNSDSWTLLANALIRITHKPKLRFYARNIIIS